MPLGKTGLFKPELRTRHSVHSLNPRRPSTVSGFEAPLFPVPRRPTLPSVSVARDLLLMRTLDGECAGGHVVSDDGTGARIGVISDRHWGDEHRIRADLHPVADGRPVFLDSVVVDGHGRRPDVRALCKERFQTRGTPARKLFCRKLLPPSFTKGSLTKL